MKFLQTKQLVKSSTGFSQDPGFESRSETALNILDEVLLVLGRSVDGRTLDGLGLLTATSGKPGTGEDAAEGGHGELLRG